MKTYNVTIYQPINPTFRVDEKQTSYRKNKYKKVYDTTFSDMFDNMSDKQVLETIYGEFNNNRPEDFKGHSLSVGDIVALNKKHYVCCPLGFKQIKFVADRYLVYDLTNYGDGIYFGGVYDTLAEAKRRLAFCEKTNSHDEDSDDFDSWNIVPIGPDEILSQVDYLQEEN